MNYQKKYNKYKTKYLNIKKILGGSEGPPNVPEGPPTVPEGFPTLPKKDLYNKEQLSPLRIQEPYSLSTSNMMYVSPPKKSPTRGRSRSPSRGDSETARRERSRSSSPDLELRRTPSHIFSPETRLALGDEEDISPLGSPFPNIPPLSLDDSPGPLDEGGFVSNQLYLEDLGGILEEQSNDLTNPYDEPRSSRSRSSKSKKKKSSKPRKPQYVPDEESILNLISKENQNHCYFDLIYDHKKNKIKYIDGQYRLRWYEKTKNNESIRKQENFDTIDKAIIRLYELIKNGIITFREDN